MEGLPYLLVRKCLAEINDSVGACWHCCRKLFCTCTALGVCDESASGSTVRRVLVAPNDIAACETLEDVGKATFIAPNDTRRREELIHW